jgi:hypothetical protein
MKRNSKTVYLFTMGESIKAFKNLRRIVDEYPNVPYFSMYRKLKKNDSYAFSNIVIQRISLY